MKYFLIVILFLITACNGNVRDFVGVTKEGPDEFQVRTYDPLQIPQNFVLKKPDTMAPKYEGDQVLVVGEKVLTQYHENKTLSSSEAAFLQKTGNVSSSNNIRKVIDREYEQTPDKEKNLIDKMIYWNDTEDTNDVVDVGKELERLKELNVKTINRTPNT